MDANFLCHQIWVFVSAAFLNHHLLHNPYLHHQYSSTRQYSAFAWVAPVYQQAQWSFLGSCPLLLINYLILGVCLQCLLCSDMQRTLLSQGNPKVVASMSFSRRTNLTHDSQPMSLQSTERNSLAARGTGVTPRCLSWPVDSFDDSLV